MIEGDTTLIELEENKHKLISLKEKLKTIGDSL